jgi:hypothetical protein
MATSVFDGKTTTPSGSASPFTIIDNQTQDTEITGISKDSALVFQPHPERWQLQEDPFIFNKDRNLFYFHGSSIRFSKRPRQPCRPPID